MRAPPRIFGALPACGERDVITIYAAMLVLLGFFAAAMLTLLVAPAYRNRAIRLTTAAMKRSMPLTEAEIRADKDRLRAENAILVHRLETKLEDASHAAARQKIEINRRDAAISALEIEVSRQRTSLEEHENARRVLEQTIMDRLPRVEHRLAEAKKLLFQRDREIAQLTQTGAKQARALEEASQLNTQQTDELHRLNAAMATRASRNREGLGDPRFDAEVALRSEIEALRAKSREQASLITRLQGMMKRTDGGAQPPAENEDAAAAGDNTAYSGPTSSEIARLRQDLAEAEATLRSVRSSAEVGEAGHAALTAEVRTLKSELQDRTTEIARLTAALTAYESSDKDDQGVKESKIALKARLSSLQAQANEQVTIIQTLRSEIAASNERLARQAAHFMEELKRLGAGTLPASGKARGAAPQTAAAASAAPVPRKPLSERINEPRPPRSPDQAPSSSSASEKNHDPDRVSGFLKALGGGSGNGAANTSEAAADSGSANGHADDAAASPAETPKAPDAAEDRSAATKKPAGRARLLDRITGLDKTSA